MIKYKHIILPIVTVLIILGLDTFSLTPLGRIAKLLVIFSGFASAILLFVFFRKFPRPLRRFGLLLLGLMAISVIDSYVIYHQSLIEGFISNSAILCSANVFLIYFLLSKFKVSVDDSIRYFLGFAWILFVMYIFLFLTHFQFESKNGEVFEFYALRKGVINIASIIYLVYFFERNHIKYLFFSLLLFSTNHWYDFQRFLFFTYLFCISVLMLSYRRDRVGVRILAIIIFALPLSLVGVASTPFGQHFIEKYSAVFSFLENPGKTMDTSLDARVIESEVAWKSIKKYPITGIGKIGESLKEQVTNVDYFYVSDIGLLGVLYTYGLFGIVVYILQLRYLFSVFKRKYKSLIIFTAALVFILVHSISTGKSIMSPMEFMLMVMFIELSRVRLPDTEING